MVENRSQHIRLSDQALTELKEALYQEIGSYAKEYNEEDLHRLGSFVLKTLALSSKIELERRKEAKSAQIHQHF